MRALVFDKTLSMDAHRVEPNSTDGDSLLRVRQAGVCSTDLEITHGYMGFRGVLGHEFVADVVSSPNKDLIGRAASLERSISSGGRCDLRLSGLSNHCRARSVLGILNHNGAFADLVRLPAVNLHVLPKSVDDDQAVFVEPLAAAFQVVKQLGTHGHSGLLEGRRWVTVLGDGAAWAAGRPGHAKRRIPGSSHRKTSGQAGDLREMVHLARPLDDISPRHDQDIVVDCTGSAAGFELAMQVVRPRGTIVLKSTAALGKPLNLAPLVIDEINVIGSRCGPFREAIRAGGEAGGCREPGFPGA